jgi:hypothetical protein
MSEDLREIAEDLGGLLDQMQAARYHELEGFLKSPQGAQAVRDKMLERIRRQMAATGVVENIEWRAEDDGTLTLTLETAALLLELIQGEGGSQPSRRELRRPWKDIYNGVLLAVGRDQGVFG